MKRKKFWIALGIIVFCAMVISIAMSLVTRLKSVTVEFRYRLSPEQTHLEANVLEQVKNDGEFAYGKNLATMSFNDNIGKIEKANPFVKVDQIVRYFPNRIGVFISERVTKYRVQAKNNPETYYILDDEFKVLKVTSTSEELAEFMDITTEILASTYTVDAEYSEGDFVTEYALMSIMKDVMSGVYGSIASYYYIDKINMPTKQSLNFEFRDSGLEVYIASLENLTEKVARAIECYTENKDEPTFDSDRYKIDVVEDDKGAVEAHLVPID